MTVVATGTPEPGDEAFYAGAPELGQFAEVADAARHADVPPAWRVVIADVRGSTSAIEAGRYKDVNALGVATIVGVQNAMRDLPLAFVFGGDGATLLVPPTRLPACEAALRGLVRLGAEAFGLELRVGLVPASELVAAGRRVRAARLRVSPAVTLAVFSGGGFSLAERWVKEATPGGRHLLDPSGDTSLDLEGFECRWRPVDSRRGTIASLLVLALAGEEAARTATYLDVIAALERLTDAPAARPIEASALRLQGLRGDYGTEARARSGAAEGPSYEAAVRRARKQAQIGRALVWLGAKAGSFDGRRYPAELAENTDFRKFDETLRMVLDVSPAELAAVTAHLEAEEARGALVHGLHTAPRALITCFVRSYAGDHLHFVDGADGGYALAARRLKDALRRKGREPG